MKIFSSVTLVLVVFTLTSLCTVYCLPQEWNDTIKEMKAEIVLKLSNFTFRPSDPILKSTGCKYHFRAEAIYQPILNKYVDKFLAIRNRYSDDFYLHLNLVRQQKKKLRELEKKILEEKTKYKAISSEKQSLIPQSNRAMQEYHETVVELDKMIVVLKEKTAVYAEVDFEKMKLLREFQMLLQDGFELKRIKWLVNTIGVVAAPIQHVSWCMKRFQESWEGLYAGRYYLPEDYEMVPKYFNWCEYGVPQ